MSEEAARCFVTPDYRLPHETVRISTLDSTPVTRCFPRMHLRIATSDGPANIDVLVCPTIATGLEEHEMKTPQHLRNVPLVPRPRDTFNLDILVGADHYWDFVGDEVIRGDGPTAVGSNLGGYLISGPARTSDQNHETTVMSISNHQLLHFDPTQYWNLESVGIHDDPITPKFDFDVEKFAATIEFRDGHYVTKFPWKVEHPALPSNYAMVKARTRNMVRKMSQQDRARYDKLIQEQLSKGFIEPVLDRKPQCGHYLPHYGVKKDSVTTPLRIVYCCNTRTRDSPSLNDCLEPGPVLIQDLLAILLRFRLHETAVCADIEKAFLNVHLHPSERDFTKFFWISDQTNPESELLELRFRTVLFGATCSPFLLNLVVQKHIATYEDTVASDVEHNLYVDNLVSGTGNTEAIRYYNTAVKMMSDGGFNLREWYSNNPELNDSRIGAHTSEKPCCSDEPVNVLGLKWIPSEDIMTCRILQPSQATTRRSVVSQTCKLFDVYGLLAPVHVAAKLFIQELQRLGGSWDEPLSEEQIGKWTIIEKNLCSATEIEWNRRLGSDIGRDRPVSLHCFADSSMKAYGCAAYVVTETGNSSLILSKNRLTPLKRPTLPRLELMACTLASNMSKFLNSAFEDYLNITETYIWTDSQIVLAWLNNDRKLPRFINNRKRQILQADAHLRFCASGDNPADLVTRGIDADALRNSTLWWNGPAWLNNREAWPAPVLSSSSKVFSFLAAYEDNETEEKIPQQDQRIDGEKVSNVIDIERFSSFTKLVRATAYVLRWRDRVRSALRPTGPLSVQELQRARAYWITLVQRTSFPAEITSLERRDVSNPLNRQLRLFIDDDCKILRKGSRLHNAPIPYDAKFPILLPKTGHFTKLIIYRAHAETLHGGLQATVNRIRQQYWIPAIYVVAKSLLRKCTTCARVNSRHYKPPVTPPLQAWRIKESPPFTHTGVDYAGPIPVKNDNNDIINVHLCLFTCAVTRAMHLELVQDLSTTQFLFAFRRFVARRSLPRKMHSDNATCFVGFASYLKTMSRDRDVMNYLSDRMIQWEFIPKRAPWHGAIWERLIGLVKSTIQKTVRKRLLTQHELNCLITEIEAVLNERPLTHGHDDDELTPLTPSHLLVGRASTHMPHPVHEPDDPDYNPTHESGIERHKNLSKTFSEYWTRFYKEYLILLRERHEFAHRSDRTECNIKPGDVVLVHSESKRPLWKLALVEELKLGNDGLPRSAQIRTANGSTNRPVTKLYPLELNIQADPVEHKPPENPNDEITLPGDVDINLNPAPETLDQVDELNQPRLRRRAAAAAARRITQQLNSEDSD